MGPQKVLSKLVISYMIFQHGTLVLTLVMMINSSSYCTATTLGNETDQLALINFKSLITEDPYNILSSWNKSTPLCQWQGVTCGPNMRVTGLYLFGQDLLGPISPHIGNLTFLEYMDLRKNRLNGELPQEIGRLSSLRHLNMTNNTLGGEIPFNLTDCKELSILDLGGNELTGEIPEGLGSLKKLVALALYRNNLQGKIPQSFGNLSSLEKLSFARNNLQGNIPNELGRLKSLTFFGIGDNNFSGIIPPSIYNISSLQVISTAKNTLVGSLPSDIGSTLPSLMYLGVAFNRFTGTIPDSLANASQIYLFDILENHFSGQVPNNLGLLSGLQYMDLSLNQLGGNPKQDLSFLESLSNCSYLNKFYFSGNFLEGQLSDSIANLSVELTQLGMGQNRIFGPIPGSLANLNNLQLLALQNNSFIGEIPSSFGRFQKLQLLYLDHNQISGQIPSSLGNMTQLSLLSLSQNAVNGSIPESLGDCKNLNYLDISQNNLFGAIPFQVISIPSLSVILNLSHNLLSGPLPAEIGKLVSLNALDISNNDLSGVIPSRIGDCSSLEYLDLRGNSFNGTIPPTLSSLKGIQYLDLSRNNLSGKIPTDLESLVYLQYLNLSFNDLEGEIPTRRVFANATAISVVGNSKLCGGISELERPLCPTQEKKKKNDSFSIKLIVLLVCVGLFLVALISFGALFWRRIKVKIISSAYLEEDKHMRISYMDLQKATNGFSSDNIIGSGGFGIVYKGELSLKESKLIIAVKVLNLENSRASKTFLAECKILSNVRHRNLLKLLTYCSSIDSKRNEFKALVYEFMPNGNLDTWLHPNEANRSRTLSPLQRLNIAIDVASAMQYLHSDCETPIVHCDLKPSNILLDDDMCAHVGDFGLARFRPKVTSEVSEISSIGLKGSIGYVAPEYGSGGDVSTYGDVYSYGIILLEMITGRRPTDDIFKDGLNLHNYVKKALPKQVRQIIDPALDIEQEVGAVEEDDGEHSDGDIEEMDDDDEVNIPSSSHGDIKLIKCIISILKIALVCSEESPR